MRKMMVFCPFWQMTLYHLFIIDLISHFCKERWRERKRKTIHQNMTITAACLAGMLHVKCFTHMPNLASQHALKLPGVACLLGRKKPVTSFFRKKEVITSARTQTDVWHVHHRNGVKKKMGTIIYQNILYIIQDLNTLYCDTPVIHVLWCALYCEVLVNAQLCSRLYISNLEDLFLLRCLSSSSDRCQWGCISISSSLLKVLMPSNGTWDKSVVLLLTKFKLNKWDSCRS